MNKNKTFKTSYPPTLRTFSQSETGDLKSYSPSGNTYTKLPNPLTDPIVSNNISYPEFDYIYHPMTPEE